ncbi:uncharacterized protein LOC144872556 [Branchiostoma floridae x Branchiostoma japonicum]
MYTEQGFYNIGALRCRGQAVDRWYPPSCAEVKSRGGHAQDSSGSYIIDPDGPGTGVEPFTVSCDFNQTVTTTVHHNREETAHVDGHEHPLSYRVDVSYAASMRQIQALMAISDSCEQNVEYHCYGSAIFYSEKESKPDKQHAAWYSREGTGMSYWPGARGHAGKCACGVTGTCDNGNPRCNCDNNDDTWRKDAGTVTDKSLLPVTGLAFGDTSIKVCFDENENIVSLLDEQGFYVLSPLRCRSSDAGTPQTTAQPLVPTSSTSKKPNFTETKHTALLTKTESSNSDSLLRSTPRNREETAIEGDQNVDRKTPSQDEDSRIQDGDMEEPSDDKKKDNQPHGDQTPEDIPNPKEKPPKDSLDEDEGEERPVEVLQKEDIDQPPNIDTGTKDENNQLITDHSSENVPNPVLQDEMVDSISRTAHGRNGAAEHGTETRQPFLNKEDLLDQETFDQWSGEQLEREDDEGIHNLPDETENPHEEPLVHEGTDIKTQPAYSTTEPPDVVGAENTDRQPFQDNPNHPVDMPQGYDDAVIGYRDGEKMNSEPAHPLEEQPGLTHENTDNNKDIDQPLENLQNPAALGQDNSQRRGDRTDGPGEVHVHERPQWVQGGDPADEDEPSGFPDSELTLEVGIPVVLTALAVAFVIAFRMPCKRLHMKTRKRSRSDGFTDVGSPRLLKSFSIQQS